MLANRKAKAAADTVPVALFRMSISDRLDDAEFRGITTKISRSGKFCAALIPPRDYEILAAIKNAMQHFGCPRILSGAECTEISKCTCIERILAMLD